MDEITEGLAPVIVKAQEVIRLLKARGSPSCWWSRTFAAPLADRHYVLEHGRIVATVRKATNWLPTEMLHELLGRWRDAIPMPTHVAPIPRQPTQETPGSSSTCSPSQTRSRR